MTISATTGTRLSAWQLGVMGAVGALAVGIGVIVGSFLMTAREGGALGVAAGYVPADAPLYVELRLEPSQAQDAAMRELLGRFPAIEGVDLDRPLADQLTERLDEMLSAEGADVSWSQDVAPWFDGRIAFAMTDVGPLADPAMTVPDPAATPMLFLVGVSDRVAAQAAIDRMRGMDGAPTFTATDHGGVAIQSVANGDTPGAYALTDDQLIIGFTADAVAEALDAHADASRSVAGAGTVGAMAGSLPNDWLAFMSWDVSGVLAAAVDAAPSAAPGVTDAFRELLEQQPMRGAMTVSAGGDRVAVDVASEPATGPFAVSNEDRGLTDEVPADAIYYSEGSSIGPAFAGLITAIKEAAASTPDGQAPIASAEAALGADLEELVSWIDDGAIAAGWDGTEPYGGLVLVPNDMDAARRRLDQLATFARLGTLDPSSGVTVDEAEVDGVTVTTIRWANPGVGGDIGMPAVPGLAVQYAITDDRAIVGIGEKFVGRALGLDAADSLASVERFTAAVGEMGGVTNAGMAWIDLDALRTVVEEAAGASDSDFGAVYTESIQPWLEPLDAIVSVSRLDGDHVVQRAALLVD